MKIHIGHQAFSTSRSARLVYFMLVSQFAILSGCTSYEPKPLNTAAHGPTSLEQLQIEATRLNGGAIVGYDVDLTDGLDLTEVGILAVINNPQLKAQRALLRVAQAQAFAAGLLPDPQIAAGFDQPTGNSAPDTGWALGLSYDIIPLITRQARMDAGRSTQEKVRLDLLWQEWQVIQQARSLAVRLQLETQQLDLLRTVHGLYLERYQHSARALGTGDITLDINGTDLTALVDVLSQTSQLEQTHNDSNHSFNLLLGLPPQTVVALTALLPAVPMDAAEVRARLSRLPELRPDLLALRAGYESQEAQVRAAILAQFPSLGIGVNRGSDTSNVDTLGLSISLSLPLFTGNRGNIAIERATRDQLFEEYQARLAETDADVDRLLQLQSVLTVQQADLQIYLPPLGILVGRAQQAYQAGDIGALTFLNMESTWVNKRLEQLNLQQACWENRIALEALLAMPSYPLAPLTIPAPIEGDSL